MAVFFVRVTLTILSIFVIAGCYHYRKLEINVLPLADIYFSHGDKIKGKYALYVDAEKMAGDFKAIGEYNCSLFTYSVNAGDEFSISVARTFENIFESVDVVSDPLDKDEMQASGFKGMIIVKVVELDVDIRFYLHFLTGQATSDAEIVVNTIVDGVSGRILETSVEANDDYKSDDGIQCDNGVDIVVGKSIEKATEEVLERIGERLLNSSQLR